MYSGGLAHTYFEALAGVMAAKSDAGGPLLLYRLSCVTHLDDVIAHLAKMTAWTECTKIMPNILRC